MQRRDRGWRRADGAHRPSVTLPGATQSMGTPSVRAQGPTLGILFPFLRENKSLALQTICIFMLMMAFALEMLALGDCAAGARHDLLLPWEQQLLLITGGSDMEPRSNKQPWGHMDLHRCGRSSCPRPQ